MCDISAHSDLLQSLNCKADHVMSQRRETKLGTYGTFDTTAWRRALRPAVDSVEEATLKYWDAVVDSADAGPTVEDLHSARRLECCWLTGDQSVVQIQGVWGDLLHTSSPLVRMCVAKKWARAVDAWYIWERDLDLEVPEHFDHGYECLCGEPLFWAVETSFEYRIVDKRARRAALYWFRQREQRRALFDMMSSM